MTSLGGKGMNDKDRKLLAEYLGEKFHGEENLQQEIKRLEAENERLRTRLLTHGDIETDAEETLKEEYDELSSK